MHCIHSSLALCITLYVLRVVSRLQGDTLSDSRSEEDHRPRLSEQAVPDISCEFHNRVGEKKSKYFIFFGLHICVFLLLCAVFLASLIMNGFIWSSANARGGHCGGSTSGM